MLYDYELEKNLDVKVVIFGFVTWSNHIRIYIIKMDSLRNSNKKKRLIRDSYSNRIFLGSCPTLKKILILFTNSHIDIHRYLLINVENLSIVFDKQFFDICHHYWE